METASHVFM